MADFKDKGDSGLGKWIDNELNALVPDIYMCLLEKKVPNLPDNENDFRRGLMGTPIENKRQALLYGLFQGFMDEYGGLQRRDIVEMVEDDINRIKDAQSKEVYGKYARANMESLFELENDREILNWWYIPQFGPKGTARLLDKLGKIDFIILDHDRYFKFLQPATTEFSAIGKGKELQRDYGDMYLLKPFIGVVTMLDEKKQIAEDLKYRIKSTLSQTPGYGNIQASIFTVFGRR